MLTRGIRAFQLLCKFMGTYIRVCGIAVQEYTKFLAFSTAFAVISRSPSHQLCNRLGKAMEKLATPPPSRIQQPSVGWNFSGDYFCIRADRVACLRVNLKRIRWLEELKLVQLFIFFRDRRMDNMTTYKGTHDHKLVDLQSCQRSTASKQNCSVGAVPEQTWEPRFSPWFVRFAGQIS